MREFRRSLPMSLLKAREAVMKNFTPHLQEQGLTAQQWRVLRALHDAANMGQAEIEPSEVGKRCYLLLPSMSRIIKNLQGRGLISRRASETDLRSSLISITPEGVALVEMMSPQSEARYEHITKVFGYGKLELLYELLEELTTKLNESDFDDSISGDPDAQNDTKGASKNSDFSVVVRRRRTERRSV